MVANSCNQLLKSIYMLVSLGSTGIGIHDGCNIKSERQKYALELHPGCILDMALSVNLAFVCAQLVVFFIGILSVVVTTHLELYGRTPCSPHACT